MYITQTNTLRHLTKEQYNCLKLMCSYSKNLYNVALYNIRQYYFQEKKFLTYENNYYLCKDNENYKLLQAGISQQIMRVVDRNFKSFFNLIKKAKNGEYRFHDISIPKYKKKDELFPLIINIGQTYISNHSFCIPVSKEFKKEHNCNIRISIPERLWNKNIKEFRILPCGKGEHFKIQYVYEQEKEDLNLDISNSIGIDVGVNNLMSCIDTFGNSFLIDGKQLKSINQYYNKKKAKLQSIKDKQKITTSTKRINRLTRKRNNKSNDYIKKSCRYIINHCQNKNIGTIVIGYNMGFKKEVNLGKRNNQNFVNIPFAYLKEHIKYLCERYNINFIEQEESYTSKASFLDLDELLVYNPDNPKTGKFSGKRVKRGLYKSKNGILVNADVNGACNILRKSNQKFNFEQLSRGLVNSPKRIRSLTNFF